MSLPHIPTTDNEDRWYKSWQAVFIVQKELLVVVKSKMEALHQSALSGLSSGSICLSANKDTVPHTCDGHFKNIIESKKVFKFKKISENSDDKKWCSSMLEFAKCFIYSRGYKGVLTIDKVDLNGFLDIINNCSEFLPVSSSQALKEVRNRTLFEYRAGYC